VSAASFPWVETEDYLRPEDVELRTTETVCPTCRLVVVNAHLVKGDCPSCWENF